MTLLSDRLTEAQTAYHDLAIGKAVVEVRDSNGETLRYTAANRGALAAYIEDLKRQIAGSTSGPMYLRLG